MYNWRKIFIHEIEILGKHQDIKNLRLLAFFVSSILKQHVHEMTPIKTVHIITIGVRVPNCVHIVRLVTRRRGPIST